MKPNAVSSLDLFEQKVRFEVPMFQRQYVWTQEQQWEPLWEDISRKFTDYIHDRNDGPLHFLGAMVLDQKQTPVIDVPKRHVIDGQQRLTTLQIFLAAFRDLCREHACDELAEELDKYTINSGMMRDKDVDRFKVWPTQLDRDQFRDVMTLGSPAKIESKHPLEKIYRSRGRYHPRPRMVEAYLFFARCLQAYFLGTSSEEPERRELPLGDRLHAGFRSLRSLQVVAIDLDATDDPQVIFETLNARGEPLLPADLLRNYIFLRAARNNESTEELYASYWSSFDDPFWRAEVTQGRLTRPRSDLFMQHFLASEKVQDVPIKHLYVEYRHWIERDVPFDSDVKKELEKLSRQGKVFRRLSEPKLADPVHGLATFLSRFDVGTAYPLLLVLADSGLSDSEWREVSTILESYLLRRAVMNWSTKAYNRIFLNAVRELKATQVSSVNLKRFLSSLTGESSAWPDDRHFEFRWMSMHAYQTLKPIRLAHVFRRLNETYMTVKNENVSVGGQLAIEHLMPQTWLEHWPLPSGLKGLTSPERWTLPPDDPTRKETERRDSAVQRIGNLTLLTAPLNSSVSNGAWDKKRKGILESSLLPLNQQLHQYDSWTEESIEKRGREMLQRALNIWPAPLKSDDRGRNGG